MSENKYTETEKDALRTALEGRQWHGRDRFETTRVCRRLRADGLILNHKWGIVSGLRPHIEDILRKA